MKNYVLAVAGTAMLTAIISVVMPRKKFSRTIEGILKLCMILVLVSPLTGLMRQDLTFFSSESGISAVDTAYINNSYALATERQLKAQFGVTVRAEVTFSAEGKSAARIYILDFGMNDETEHIHIVSGIEETVKTLLDTENVEVHCDGSA